MLKSPILCLAMALTVGAAGCATGPSHTGRGSADLSWHQEVRARALREFQQARFLKPSSQALFGLERDLAPLIVQEIFDETPEEMKASGFGMPRLGNDGFVTVDTSHPIIYARAHEVDIDGVPHWLVRYAWFFQPATAVLTIEELPCQILDIVTDRDGYPLAWEVTGPLAGKLARSISPHVLFASNVLEDRAAEAFGEPLSGRRFTVERGLRDTPNAAVARLVEQGPLPMGPYVYLAANTHEATTVLCRCSPSQVDRLVNIDFYELAPLSELPEPRHGDLAVSAALSSAVDEPIYHVFRSPMWKLLRWPPPKKDRLDTR